MLWAAAKNRQLVGRPASKWEERELSSNFSKAGKDIAFHEITESQGPTVSLWDSEWGQIFQKVESKIPSGSRSSREAMFISARDRQPPIPDTHLHAVGPHFGIKWHMCNNNGKFLMLDQLQACSLHGPHLFGVLLFGGWTCRCIVTGENDENDIGKLEFCDCDVNSCVS